MAISRESIKLWAGESPSQRNFIEGERVLYAGHIVKCGINDQNERQPNTLNFVALCLQTSQVKGNMHEIDGQIKNGEITFVKCSCKSGLGQQCKHILATLLYLERVEERDLPIVTSTDRKCGWKKLQQKAVAQYAAAPLENHPCFRPPDQKMKLDDETMASMLEWLKTRNDGAVGKHAKGRHNPVSLATNQVPTITAIEGKTIEEIFVRQKSSTLMDKIKKSHVMTPKDCCQKVLDEFQTDIRTLCKETKLYYLQWSEERQYRITGTTCYRLFTYTQNKNANWSAKCDAHFAPKDFHSEHTEYGKKTEKEARDTYVQSTKKIVVEVGLVICQHNPWLAMSPDGIIVGENGSHELLEIKCPSKGKMITVSEAIKESFGKCLNMNCEPISLKKKHTYYGQVQLGMAILNVKRTSFVIYAPHDKSFIDVTVDIDENFVIEMLLKLKQVYYNVMLPRVCSRKNGRDHSVDENENTMNIL